MESSGELAGVALVTAGMSAQALGATQRQQQQPPPSPSSEAPEAVDKVAALHKLYDEDRDGLMTMTDVCRLEKDTAGEEVDAESWLALCELVGVPKPSAGSQWGVAELRRLYGLEGGEEELRRAWAKMSGRWRD